MDTNTRQKSYQDECFTPKRSLARTPPTKKQQEKETENISPNVTQEAPLVKDRQQNQAAVKVDKTRKVQNSSSTAKHAALKRRSTHAIADEQGKKKDSLNSAIDDVPPPSRWEIPRTPVRVVEHVQLQLATVPGAHSSGGGESGRSSLRRTPVRIRTPYHPLAHSNKAPPVMRPTEKTPAVGKEGGGAEGSRSAAIVQGIDDDKPAREGEGGSEDEAAVTIMSPPISVSKGIGTLPGLNCTENDLAFLQRMQSIKKYEELKAEAEKLKKAHKTAAEQREQFQHEVLKIERDLRDMKLTYQEAASSVDTLIANTIDTSLLAGESPHSTSATSSALKHESKAGSQSEGASLTEAKLAKLRKLNHLSSARVEKSEKEMKGKLEEVERARLQLQNEVSKEERKREEEAELQSKLQTTKQEQERWKQKVDQEEELYTSLKNKLREAQTELANLQQETQEMDEATVSLPAIQEEEGKPAREAEEKRRTEERLKRLIRRCELYIQRHQMLKEMSTKK